MVGSATRNNWRPVQIRGIRRAAEDQAGANLGEPDAQIEWLADGAVRFYPFQIWVSSSPFFSGQIRRWCQARNNARVLLSGSLDLFSNRHEKSGNKQFVTELSKWVFHERGHLKAINIKHHKAGETTEPSMYRINDDLEYSVEIYEWSGTNWQPYIAHDVQVQFYMMSPYVLKTLSNDHKGLYYTSFRVPDVYGVFQFKVEYQRLGYTTLSLSKQIPVRPFKHNEYERFITAAYPYYGASFSMMTGFFLFTVIYLYNK